LIGGAAAVRYLFVDAGPHGWGKLLPALGHCLFHRSGAGAAGCGRRRQQRQTNEENFEHALHRTPCILRHPAFKAALPFSKSRRTILCTNVVARERTTICP
jgi:hypothetical protein